MKKIAMIAHDILKEYIKEDSICADFTVGQGNDTVFLASCTPKGKVYGFDIQEEAIIQTKEKLLKLDLQHVSLALASHEQLTSYIKEPLDAGIFNFGFLPHGNPAITTMCESSVRAVTLAFQQLKIHGVLVLVLYPGHEEGKRELEQLTNWCKQLDTHIASILQVSMLHKPQAPQIYAIEKLGELI